MRARAVIYARVSTEAQVEKGISLDMQVARCCEYSQERGFDLVDTVVDAGLSAKDIEHRPGLKRVLDLITRRKISHVVTYKLDRLSRNTLEALQMVALMTKCGVDLHIVDEQAAVRTGSADDEFMLTLKAGLATRERKLVGERTKAALNRKREKCEYCGGEAPYGFRQVANVLMEDEAEQAVIRKVRNLRQKDYSIRQIVHRLEQDGVLNRRGKPFSKTAIERILRKAA